MKSRVTVPVQCFRVTLPPPHCTLDPTENPISRGMHKSNRLLNPPTLHLLRCCSLSQLLSRLIRSPELSRSLTFLKKRLLLSLKLTRFVPLSPFNPSLPLTEELPRPFLPLPLKMPWNLSVSLSQIPLCHRLPTCPSYSRSHPSQRVSDGLKSSSTSRPTTPRRMQKASPTAGR